MSSTSLVDDSGFESRAVLPTRATEDAQRRIARGALWSGAAQAITVASTFCLTVLLVRGMPSNQYGTLVTALAASSLASILTTFGLGQAVAQVAGADSAVMAGKAVQQATRTGLRTGMAIAIATSVLGIGGLVVSIWIRPRTNVVPPLLALVPLVALAPLASVLSGSLQAGYRPRALALSNIINSGAALAISGTLLALSQRAALPIAGARSAAAAAAVAYLLVAARRFWLRAATDRNRDGETTSTQAARSTTQRRIFRLGAAMMLTGVFVTAVSQFDVLVLGLFQGAAPTSQYQPVSRLLDVILQFPGFLAAFYLPVVAAAAAAGESGTVKALYHWSSRWLFALCSPALALLIVRPEALVAVLYGRPLANAAVIARVLGGAAVVHIALGVNWLTLAAHGRARAVGGRLGISLCVDVVACCALVPTLGAIGAGIATALALLTANVLCNIALYRSLRIPPVDRASLATVVVFAAVAAVSVLLGSLPRSDSLRLLVIATSVGAATSASAFLSSRAEERRIASVLLRRLLLQAAGHSGIVR